MDWLTRLAHHYRFEPPPHPPVACIDTGFSCVKAGYPLIDAYDHPYQSFQARLQAEQRYGFLPLPQIIRHTVLAAHDFGGDVRLPASRFDQAMKVISHPLSEENQVRRLALPDPHHAGGIPTALQFSRLQHQKGSVVWFHHRSPFSMAANICDMERFGRWLYRRPELCRHLINLAQTHLSNVLAYWIETFGTENLAVYNSSPMESNQLISPAHFREFALPAHIHYVEKLIELGIQRYFFHVCGDQGRNLPYLKAIARHWPHPAVISIGHEIGLQQAADFFPDDIIYGNIDPRVIQSGSPRDVYALCHQALEEGQRIKNGFILAPGCDLPVASPEENVLAMYQAVKDFG